MTPFCVAESSLSRHPRLSIRDEHSYLRPPFLIIHITRSIRVPTYDYHCEQNSRTVTVQHGMKDAIQTWGQLCQRAGLEPSDTPANAPVERIISGGIALPIASASPALPMANCCGHPASCGHGH